ncbi:MAG TPA: APC family permease [bacterium]|nr:APC family permease [bacterium]
MSTTTGFRKSLTLTGVTVNAMALIAPGAFLWITYQLQAAQVDATGASTAMDIWPGLALALIIAFLTAISYAMLSERYPDAGTGSSYYFAEKAFLDKEEHEFHRWARVAKFIVGWVSHLYYWVYPGVMVAMMATMIVYLAGLFNIAIPPLAQVAIAVVFSFLTGYVAYRGITGSTLVSLFINAIQIAALVVISVLALSYRFGNPHHVVFLHPTLGSVLLPHRLSHVLFQSTIAILLLVGFESATALTAEALHPSFVSRGVILSLILQGLICYLFEYFAAGAWINTAYTIKDAGGKLLTGFAAASASQAPIGDMVRALGDTLLGGIGFSLLLLVAVTVAIAVFGTTLACMNTGVRLSYAMGRDEEIPAILGLLHGRFATPHFGVLLMASASAVIGGFGVLSVTNLTAMTLLSNIGTFLLYGLTNVVALVAFRRDPRARAATHVVIPGLGILANVAMLLAVLYLGVLGGGDTRIAALISIVATAGWFLFGLAYFIANTRARGSQAWAPRPADPA